MRNWNGNNFSFIPHVCYFLYHLWVAASEDRTLTILFSIQMGGEETQPQEHHHPYHILSEFRHSFLSFSKNHQKTSVDKKIQTQETLLYRPRTLYFPRTVAQRESVSHLLILNWPEHFIWRRCFEICSGNNNTSLLHDLVIHSINKGVTSSYVQEQGEIL